MTDIEKSPITNPLTVATNKADRETFIDHIKKVIADHMPDTSTAKGRDAIRSLAAKVVKSKTAVVKAVNTHTEEMRQAVKDMNAERDSVETELAELAAMARKPLTEWEVAEKARQERMDAIIESVKTAHSSAVLLGTMDAMEKAIVYLTDVDFDGLDFGEMQEALDMQISHQIELCKKSLADMAKAEADRLELEELRQLKADRDAKEAAEIAAREAAELKAQQEKAEADRIANEKRLADEKAAQDKINAEKKAEAERIERENAIKEAEERAASAERKRLQDEADERVRKAEQEAADAIAANNKRIADEKAESDARAAREADVAHKGAVMGAAKEAIMSLGADETTARAIVLAIKAGEIPNVTISF